MKVYKEVNSYDDFDFWSGARDTVKYLTSDEVEQIFSMLEEIYPEGMTETEICIMNVATGSAVTLAVFLLGLNLLQKGRKKY